MFDLAEAYNEYVADASSILGNGPMAHSGRELVDVLSTDPTGIHNDEVWASFLAAQSSCTREDASMYTDIIAAGLGAAAREASKAKSDADTAAFPEILDCLEKYAFAAHLRLVELDKQIARASQKVTARRTASTAASVAAEAAQACQLLGALSSVVSIGLDALLSTTVARDIFASMYLRPAFRMLEQELVVKHEDMRKHIFRAISLGIKYQGQLSVVHASVTQLLTYYSHTAEPLAELMLVLHNEYDHTGLASLVIRDLGNREFTAQDTKGPKPVATFIIQLARLLPQVVHQQISLLLPLLDSPAPSLRTAMVEMVGTVATYLARNGETASEDPALHAAAIDDLVDLLKEHTNDAYSYTRARALQVLLSLCDTPYSKNVYRNGFSAVAAGKIEDKAQVVRHNAIKLMSKLITDHPFSLVEGSQLNIEDWERRREQVAKELNKDLDEAEQSLVIDSTALEPPTPSTRPMLSETEALDADAADNSSEPIAPDAPTGPDIEVVRRLQLMLRYHEDAIAFINQINDSLRTAGYLLRSKSKSDVVDAMDLFVLADAYGVKVAKAGIRNIVHLVWAKASNDEKDTIQKHAVDCYYDLFMNPPARLSTSDAALYVAKNLISLTYGASVGELTSLERLLGLAMQEQMIDPSAVKILWRIYSYDQKEISKKQRRGATIVLGILSKHDRNIALSGLEVLQKIGLGHKGQGDMELAKYSCVILQHIVSSGDWKKGEVPSRINDDHPVFEKLVELIAKPSESPEWFGMAQEALRAINDLAESPDAVFSKLVRYLHALSFGDSSDNRQDHFAQLIFVVGEVAIRLLVHLERCEIAFKRARITNEENAASAKKGGKGHDESSNTIQGDEMDLVASGGTTEDDFVDAIREIKEREILYSDRSLLARYAPVVSDLCRDELQNSQSRMLSIAATSSLVKFMCVSSIYCETHMDLLLGIMKASDDSVIRSNIVVAMGDIAVCFNHIMDSHTDFLYGQLNDKFLVVQRTAVVTLTFLILSGQIKVKGQLGEMAKALESTDSKISALAHMFFSELATKENAIYNSFLDILSGISDDSELSEVARHRIIKFLLSFIDKERHVKQVTDKLAARLPRCDVPSQWSDIIFVLRNLPGDKPQALTDLMDRGFQKFAAA